MPGQNKDYKGLFNTREDYLAAQSKYREKVKLDPILSQQRRISQIKSMGLKYFDTPLPNSSDVKELVAYLNNILPIRITNQNMVSNLKDVEYPKYPTHKRSKDEVLTTEEYKNKRTIARRRSYLLNYVRYQAITMKELNSYIGDINQRISEFDIFNELPRVEEIL